MGKNLSFKEWKAKKNQDPNFREAAKEYEVAYKIAQLRVKRGLTQAELAELVGTKQSSIARIESGRTQPRTSFLRSIVKALDGDLDIDIRPKEEVKEKGKVIIRTVVVEEPKYLPIITGSVQWGSPEYVDNTQYAYPHEDFVQ